MGNRIITAPAQVPCSGAKRLNKVLDEASTAVLGENNLLCGEKRITMKTIIHIGQHKTGTTSIQRFLQDNKITLTKNGLYVPSKIAGYNYPSHFILNVYALADDRYSSKKEKIIAEKGKHYLSELKIVLKKDIEQIYKDALYKKCDKVLWSNEGLYLLNTVTEYKRLKQLFSEYSTEIEVVCCFRDVKSYRESYIKQLGKQKISLSNNPDSCRYFEPDSWLFDYERKTCYQRFLIHVLFFHMTQMIT